VSISVFILSGLLINIHWFHCYLMYMLFNIFLISVCWSVLLCVWIASKSWFITLGDDETGQPLKEIERCVGIIESDLQQWHNRQNLFTKQRDHLLSNKENKENSSSGHVISRASSLPSISLQVTCTLSFCQGAP